MSVNKFKIVKTSTDKYINIPVEIKWDFYGRDDSIDEIQEGIIEKVVGKPKDFELARFENKQYPGDSYETSVNYNFYFYNGIPANINVANSNSWELTYNSEGFSDKDIYYTTKPFQKSFFKLDFYDTKDGKTQKNYFTVILFANQSSDVLKSISVYLPDVNISIPKFKLDFVGTQKEGYFFYWLKSREFLNIDTFYMSAKFFNGSTGNFVKMINRSQLSPELSGDKFGFNGEKYFYYKVKLDYSDYTYQIFDYVTGSDLRVGNESNPINWYEYVNPK
jgi:hypothetical protein